MRCNNKKCDRLKYCEEIHNRNNSILNKDDKIMISNNLFLELNYSNRFVKRGIPDEGFHWGCFSIVNGDDDNYILKKDGKELIRYSYLELVDLCNDAFQKLIEDGDIKLS